MRDWRRRKQREGRRDEQKQKRQRYRCARARARLFQSLEPLNSSCSTLAQAHEATPRQRDGEKGREGIATTPRETIALDVNLVLLRLFPHPTLPTYLRRQSPPACVARSLVARHMEAVRLLLRQQQQQQKRGLQNHRRRESSPSALLLPPPLLLHRLQQRAWEQGGSRGAWLVRARDRL